MEKRKEFGHKNNGYTSKKIKEQNLVWGDVAQH